MNMIEDLYLSLEKSKLLNEAGIMKDVEIDGHWQYIEQVSDTEED